MRPPDQGRGVRSPRCGHGQTLPRLPPAVGCPPPSAHRSTSLLPRRAHAPTAAPHRWPAAPRRHQHGGVPPARLVQHLREPVPAMICWFLPPWRLHGVAAVRAVVRDDRKKIINGLAPLRGDGSVRVACGLPTSPSVSRLRRSPNRNRSARLRRVLPGQHGSGGCPLMSATKSGFTGGPFVIRLTWSRGCGVAARSSWQRWPRTRATNTNGSSPFATEPMQAVRPCGAVSGQLSRSGHRRVAEERLNSSLIVPALARAQRPPRRGPADPRRGETISTSTSARL